MILHDAHNHLQHPRLAPFLEEALATLATLPFGRAVINGTSESDWASVNGLADRHSWSIPSFGVHPWYVEDVSRNWAATLRGSLERCPMAGVGEIGLDRWIAGHDLSVQIPIFREQLAIACELNRPATIHCVRAWGAVWDVVREADLPDCGFLLHAYGGPSEMVTEFVERGAYFSFSPYFLHERKAAQRALFAELPLNRVLVETDAPDLAPPPEKSRYQIYDADGKFVNHPANILLAYEALAELRGMPLEKLAGAIDENFQRLFGSAANDHRESLLSLPERGSDR
jgi:TatD DNase family protein